MGLLHEHESYMTDPDLRGGDQLNETELRVRQQRIRADERATHAPVVVAVGLRTPENVGAIIRQAEAAGSRRVILVDTRCAADTTRIGRIARSADRYLQVDHMNTDMFIRTLSELAPLVAVEITSTSGNLYQTALPAQCCLVTGAEREGIPPVILEQCEAAVHIPMYGQNTSMNVSHALTLALYEWRRQYGN